MLTNLNGWQRLWVLTMTLGLIAAASIAIYTQPSIAEINNSSHLYELLKPEHRSLLSLHDSERPSLTSEELGFQGEMPNGHVLVFRKGVTEEQTLPVAREYNSLIEEKLLKKQIMHFGLALVIWFTVSIFVYLLGWAIAWVRRGFASIKHK